MGVVCLWIYFNVLVHSYSRLRLRLSAFQKNLIFSRSRRRRLFAKEYVRVTRTELMQNEHETVIFYAWSRSFNREMPEPGLVRAPLPGYPSMASNFWPCSTTLDYWFAQLVQQRYLKKKKISCKLQGTLLLPCLFVLLLKMRGVEI
jgi:hypothetical protein